MAKEVAELKEEAQTLKRSTIRSEILLPQKKSYCTEWPFFPFFISIVFLLIFIYTFEVLIPVYHNNLVCICHPVIVLRQCHLVPEIQGFTLLRTCSQRHQKPLSLWHLNYRKLKSENEPLTALADGTKFDPFPTRKQF